MGRFKPQKAVVRETLRIAAGVFVLVAIMIAVYAMLGKLTLGTVLGGLYTGVLSILNFFIMGLTVQGIADAAAQKDRSDDEMESFKKHMKAKMQLSYSGRMIFVLVLVIVGISVFGFDPLATIIPLLFPRFVITAMSLKSKNVSSEGSAKE